MTDPDPHTDTEYEDTATGRDGAGPEDAQQASDSTDAYPFPSEALARDVERVVEELGRPPSIEAYNERGAHAAATIADRFGDGSWDDALATLGHPPRGRDTRIARQELIDDLHRVADEVGRPPSRQEYTEIGRYSPKPVVTRLGDGSWVAALERIGYTVSDRGQRLAVSDDTLGGDVSRVASQLGRPPTVVEYQERGTYAPTTISRRFGDGIWGAALESLGYDPTARGTELPTDETLREAVEQVVADLGRPPTRGDFADRCELEPQTVANRFGDGLWRAALANLDYDVSDLREPDAIPEDTLREDVARVVEELGHVPSVREYDDHDEFAAQTIGNRFGAGSWSDALETLGYSRPQSYGPTISAETLRNDVHRVVEELGTTPTMREYEAVGTYSARTIAERLGDGSWVTALQNLGYDRE